MSKITLNIDASAFKESGCLRRLYWTVVSGYREKLQNNDVEYGSAFHEYVKVMKISGGNHAMAFQAAVKRFAVPMNIKPEKKYMDNIHLLKTCSDFWELWVAKDDFETLINPADGSPMVELKFSYPYYSDDLVEVNLRGTIDDLCKHKHGVYALRDYKTTSSYKEEEYLSQYELSPQLMFYRMILKYYALTYPNSIFDTINRLDVGCFVDGVFLHGAAKPATFKRSRVFMFPRSQMDEFEKLVKRKVLDLISFVKEQILPDREGMLNGSCVTVYGGCKFATACKQIDLISTQHILNRHFIQRVYDPLNFGAEHNKQTSQTV